MGRIMRTLQEQNPLEECRVVYIYVYKYTTHAARRHKYVDSSSVILRNTILRNKIL